MTGDDIPFLDRLGEQLQHAELPSRRPAPVLRRAALAAAVVLVLGVGATVALDTFRSDPAAAGVDVRQVGNRVQLRIEGKAPPAAEIEEVAHRNGLDIRVEEVPVGPSAVGQLFMPEQGPAPGVLRFGPQDALDVHDRGFSAISFPVNWKGYVVLQIGRAARPDEDQYAQPSNALARGESLSCLRGHVPDDAQERAKHDGITLRWWVHDPDGTMRREIPFDPSWGEAGYRVAYAMGIGPRLAVVELTPGGTEIEPRWFAEFPSC